MADNVTVEYAWCVGVRAKYIGPSNTLGSRWRVWRADETYRDDPDAVTVPYDYAISSGGEQAAAAIRVYLAGKGDNTSWHGTWRVACAGDSEYIAVKGASAEVNV